MKLGRCSHGDPVRRDRDERREDMMSVASWVPRKVRRYMRARVRFLKYFSYETPYYDGDRHALHIGKRVGVANTMFNMSCGDICVGDYTILSHNVMVMTGRHLFQEGLRASLANGTKSRFWGGGPEEVPPSGYDIHIGSGCWIAAGAIIFGGVTIGDNLIIAAGAVVTHDIPEYSIAGGIPAHVIGDTRQSK
jgi:acetyltransferase-like isoleucine patch superfamily enzyme